MSKLALSQNKTKNTRANVGNIKPHFEVLFAVILHIIHNAQAMLQCYKVTKLSYQKKVIEKSSLLRKEVAN